MELEKKEKEIIETALIEWENNELITSEKAEELRGSLHLKKASGQVAQYFFIIAIACTLLAFGAIFIDDKLLEQIKQYFDIGNVAIAISCTIIAVLWFGYMAKKRRIFNSLVYDLYMVLGALVSLCALVYYCKDIGFGPQYTGFFALATVLLLLLGIFFKSGALWMAGILSIMGLYGSFGEWQQNDENLFWGMNYPMRFTVFGLVVILVAFIQTKIKAVQFTQKQTYVMGLLIFFTGLWGISIFGNYGQWEVWEKVRQVQVIGYSVALAVASVAALLLGIKYRDDTARDFGIMFIIVNLYSRYFEFFWDTTNKGIFFLILAVSFGILGWQIERRMKKKAKLS